LIADLPKDAMLIADKGYDANALREAVAQRGAWANIPPKANRKTPICFSKHLYKARNLVERFFNKIKQFRRIATRYDKLAETFLAALNIRSPPSASGYAIISRCPSLCPLQERRSARPWLSLPIWDRQAGS
jgi:transposase